MHSIPVSRRSKSVLLIACGLLAFALTQASTLRAAEPTYQLNDRVETNVSVFGWQKGTIVEIGKGDHEGQLRVHGDGFPNNYPGWIRLPSKFIRKLAGAAPAAAPVTDSATGPRLGKYLIYAYGAPSAPRIFLGHIELLAGGKYRLSRTTTGDYFGNGAYSFDPASKRVEWISGPYKDEAGWGGGFEIDREGKTHTIRLRRGTIATNSTD